MGAKLLGFVAAMLAIIGCGSPRPPRLGRNPVDTIITVAKNATRDTIIMHISRDTIIMHVTVLADSCKRVPRPRGCPRPVAAARRDTIIIK